MARGHWIFGCLLWVLLLTHNAAEAQVANVLSSVGAVNRGAATAMPLDASNSQDWNPAGISDLPATELDLSTQPSFPHISLEASLPASMQGATIPATESAGFVSDQNRFYLSNAIGFVKKTDSPWTFGVLTSTVFGSGVRYPEGRNPFTMPPPHSHDSGEIKEKGDLIYIAPTVAYRLSEHFAVGVQPNIAVTSLQASPFARLTPNDANHDGIPSYPRTNRAWAVGTGVQGGVYFRHKDVRLGVSLKSPQWFTPYHFKSKDELGQTQHFTAQFTGPMILSMGVGYSGIPRTHLSTDVRYVNYSHTQGYKESGFDSSGAVRGLGWKSIWAVITSAQYQLTPKCFVRMAYSYSQCPVQPQLTSFSVGAPALVKHQMSVALAYRFRPNMALAVSYQHGFKNSSEGPIQGINGPIPGSSVRITSSLDSVAATLVFLFK